MIDVITLARKFGFFDGLPGALQVGKANVPLQHFTVHGLDKFVNGAQQCQRVRVTHLSFDHRTQQPILLKIFLKGSGITDFSAQIFLNVRFRLGTRSVLRRLITKTVNVL
ncbi:hypothetical protein A256_03787 [Pseudomonas syringae pv. actinidiae ICMP 19103]|nr:hypothetical protein A256_03787 [Pseudomonas syringae pv. actinidiae ICMP 19103]EPM87336.1 hypothetical protein A260_13324 [Pseudomonas syringae pv. actinidiae ICMP 19068]EPM95578.1 hypothetical protein A259_32561 [Pseudomonas syringae pv. actinidiae ICMP 19070]EPM98735.1 hypothetical protein A258_03737 [Pseudomonas syringae pv. actinidiae ICMP 19104]EPN06215.1 hypothetical protein A253_03797 [Pseudomonas syringae pv. actinidiae ICMP 19102]EPN12421.1 hypothetical protein A252_03797 [Pseudom